MILRRNHLHKGKEVTAPDNSPCPATALVSLAENILGKELTWRHLAGDTSSKVFWRITRGDQTWIGVDGSGLESYRRKENQSFERIGRHLAAAGLPVPQIIAAKSTQGIFIIEDLGDVRLCDAVLKMDPPARIETYRKVLKALFDIQYKGAVGFNPDWCSQTKRYDVPTILRYETTYFTDRFINEYLGRPTNSPDLMAEFSALAERAAACQPQVFLHRDFQSHNILIKGGKIWIVDFQGGRLGPPGYDLAALLIDPFVNLSTSEQSLLLDDYAALVEGRGGIKASAFYQDYEYLALHRHFQILGAFAWLAKVKGRQEYSRILPHGLNMLKKRISHSIFDAYVNIRELIHSLEVS